MNIRVIENKKDFLNLKNDWDRLSQDLITVNKFEWLYKWWNNFEKGNDLKILIVEKDRKIIGIAPLYIENSRALRFFPFKKLCFLGGRISDYLDFIIDQNQNREAVFSAFLDYILNNLSCDFIDLKQIYSNYPNFDLWEKYADSLNLNFNFHRECTKANISLFGSYQEYFNQLSKNLKSDLKTKTNRINKQNMNVEYLFKTDITEEDIDKIAHINLKRQEFLHQKGDYTRFSYFLGSKNNNFIKDYFCKGESNSNMLVYMLINDSIASYILLLLDKSYISYWNTAFDPDYEMYSPTKLLINEVMKYAFDNNYEYFDFMRGTEKYKLQWSNETGKIYDLTKNLTLKANCIFLYRKLNLNNLARRLKRLISKNTGDLYIFDVQ